jgi:hypothetical protein
VVIERLRNGPWWVLAIVGGGVFFAGQFALVLLEATTWQGRLVGGLFALLVSAVFGIVMARFTVRWRSKLAPLLQGPDGTLLPVDERRAIGRATQRGPLPTEPQQRRAAAGLARASHDIMRRQRWYAVPTYAVMIAISLYLAVAESAWWALATPLFAGLLVYWLWAYRQVRRRLPLLEAPSSS